MDFIKILILVLVSTAFFACSHRVVSTPVTGDLAAVQVGDTVPPMLPPKREAIKPVDPLDGKTFSFTARDADVRTVLYAIAVDVGLNLVVNPDVQFSDKINANFVNTPMKDVLDVVMDMSDIYYEVRGNIMRVYKYRTTNFNVPYLNTVTSNQISLGGDVVGGTGSVDSGLTGEFSIETGFEEESNDYFTMIEENISAVIAGDSASYITVNRLAGIVTVNTTHNKFEQIRRLVDNIVENTVRQVQIEAKILEVTLSDSMSYGINWSYLFKDGSAIFNQLIGADGYNSSVNLAVGSDFNAAITAIAEYGKTDTLANPRVTVLSGQGAILTAGTVTPFWEQEVTVDTASGYISRDVSYEKYDVLDGITLGISAFVHDDNTVMLNVVPITTRINGTTEVRDGDTLMGSAPILDIKETGTSVQVENGTILVIGGLISTNDRNVKQGVPFLGSIPLLGYLFSAETVEVEKKELVIMIKPTVINSNSRATIK